MRITIRVKSKAASANSSFSAPEKHRNSGSGQAETSGAPAGLQPLALQCTALVKFLLYMCFLVMYYSIRLDKSNIQYRFIQITDLKGFFNGDSLEFRNKILP